MSSSRSSRRSAGWRGPAQLILRLVLMGVGLGLLTGTGLRLLAPRVQQQKISLPSWLADQALITTLLGEAVEPPGAEDTAKHKKNAPAVAKGLKQARFAPRQEIKALSQRWVELAAQQTDLEASAYMLILDDGRFAAMQAERPMAAASSIKTPILLAVLELLDQGTLQWNEPLTLTEELVGGGAGWMASRPLGSRFPTYEVATEMIRVSDNSATNLMIARAGGMDRVNSRFQELDLPSTVVNNWLPDLDGTNTTSARDLSRAIALVDSGELLAPRSRDLFREVMGTSITNTLLPTGLMRGLGGAQGATDASLARKGYRVYNKTGDIGIAYADAGLIELPDGRRAVAGFLVEGPFNDPRSTELIRQLAAAMAPHLKSTPVPP
ncbi:serine hydrolase [Synechococcus sp. MU1642]|uniref:serine hydrolase n=1 Tax=Synechococcus sp. MU1642 TaxID=2508348 RepID=UPI001CF81680|nr:serine hydrolase [Synechococcus sp. MU1642]MCB4406219.1 serine hydrolase [Synechococcus sp. MU1642]